MLRGFSRCVVPSFSQCGLRYVAIQAPQWRGRRGMAVVTVPVPRMGESISEGSIAKWFKEVGDHTEVLEVVAEIATDKVSVEITSTHAGKIVELCADVDQQVKVGGDLFKVDTDAVGKKAEAATPAATPSAPSSSPSAPSSSPAAPAKSAAPAATPSPPSPKKEVAKSSAGGAKTGGGVAVAISGAARTETRVPMSRMRLRIAQRLKDSQNTNAILTTFNEIDMHNLIEMRNTHKDEFEKKHGVKLGFMSAFVKAAANALTHEATLNAVIDNNEIVYRNYVDISVAVSSPTGLVVPVLRDVHLMNFADIEKAINNYGEKAMNNTLAIEDMVGGTFTVSNGGVFGSLMSTPIINPPQSAVLGMHGINKRAWVVNDQIVIRPIMVVAMSYDHRLVDGREAVVFLRHIKRQIENPLSMLLNL